MRALLTISLPAEMRALLDRVVEAGEYGTASEVLREALRDWTRKRAMQSLEIAAATRRAERDAA
jgi:antitoxin ParD1/3/4